MENKTGRTIKAVIYLCAVFLFFFIYSPVINVSGQEHMSIELLDNDGNIKMGNGEVIVTAGFGYKGRCKYERNLRADVTVESRKKDYSGKFRVEYLIPGTDNSVMVQKSITIPEGEESKIQLALPPLPYIEDMVIKASMCDENGEELFCRYFVLYTSGDNVSCAFIGILSGSQDQMGYFIKYLSPGRGFLQDDKNLVFMIEADDITEDARMLSTLDVILIDNFDTGSFSESQVKAVMEWVDEGGTLLLGGGVNARQVLKAFMGNIKGCQTGDTRVINTNFGVSEKELVKLNGKALHNKKIPLNITPLYIKGAKTVLTDGSEELISGVQYGKGNVLMSAFSFALEDDETELYGAFLANLAAGSLGSQRKACMGLTRQNQGNINVYNHDGYSYKGITMLLNETGALPNIKLYVVIMLVYLLFVGPLSYVIVKKRDKRSLLWIIVPSFSVIFSIIIYLIGTSTRIQEPYINYASVIELPEKGSRANKVDTTFSITSPFSGPYEVQVSKDTGVFPEIIDAGNYYMPGGYSEECNKLKYGIEDVAGSSEIIINDVPAFEGAYFSMENKSTSKGTVQIGITEENGTGTGTVYNKMSCGLENCLLFHNGTIYYIGNLKAGQSVNLGNTEVYEIMPGQEEAGEETVSYEYDLEELLEEVMGCRLSDNNSGNILKRRMCMILDFALDNNAGSSWFYGFVQYGGETGFAGNFMYNSYGETGVYKYIN